MTRRVLFVSWDGPQSVYFESLFLPILKRLGERGWRFHVLQFGWGPPERRRELARAAERADIGFSHVTVWRRPVALGSLATALWGARHIVRLIRRHRIELLFARSLLPALACLVARRRMTQVPLLFDADGLPADERVEFGGAGVNALSTILLRDIEAAATRSADTVLTRSTAARDILLARAGAGTRADKFFVVPNCRDEKCFRPLTPEERRQGKTQLGITGGGPLLVYAGSSLAGKYGGRPLLELVRRVQAKRPDTQLLLLLTDPDEGHALLQAHAPELAAATLVRRAAPEQVGSMMATADLGIATIEPGFSMQGAAAVKLGEYLLSGLPVVATAGVGDAHKTLAGPACCFLLNNGAAELQRAADWFCSMSQGERETLRRTARQLGIQHFGLDRGIAPYELALDFAASIRA